MSGGAWKVAYADFVTAMMALFMVLWISAQDEEIVFKTVEYFKSPFDVGFNTKSDQASGGGLGDGQKGQDMQQLNISAQQESKSSMVDLAFLSKMAQDFAQKLNVSQHLDEKRKVTVRVDSNGLHITLFNKNDQPIFKHNEAVFTEWGEYMIQNLSWMIDRSEMPITIGAYIQKGYHTADPNYGPWELTVDRANAARKALEKMVLKPGRIFQVSGFVDSTPLPNVDPTQEENQRLEISLLVE